MIWEYIKTYDVHYSEIYDRGHDRTGCVFCMFGVHMEGSPNRFQLMKETHPKLYEYGKVLGIDNVMKELGLEY